MVGCPPRLRCCECADVLSGLQPNLGQGAQSALQDAQLLAQVGPARSCARSRGLHCCSILQMVRRLQCVQTCPVLLLRSRCACSHVMQLLNRHWSMLGMMWTQRLPSTMPAGTLKRWPCIAWTALPGEAAMRAELLGMGLRVSACNLRPALPASSIGM